MHKSSRRLACTVITILSASACTQAESITEPGIQLSAARQVSGPGYTAQEVGFLPGDTQSAAYGVNDLGYVVGESIPPFSGGLTYSRAFLRTGWGMVELSSQGVALAVSSGSPIYVAGERHIGSATYVEGIAPARWTFDPATGSVAEEIVASAGNVEDINDAGLMIGAAGGQATLWPVGADPITIPPPPGYAGGNGKGINNAGYATVTFSGSGVFSRGFLVVEGNFIELTPAPGHTMSFAGEVSEPVNGLVYVSGISAADTETDYHLARWTVNIESRTVESIEARKERSEGRGISDGGVAPGQLEKNGTSSAVAWTLSGTIALKPTRGGSLTNTEDASANGRYIVGNAAYKGFSSRGLIWTRTP